MPEKTSRRIAEADSASRLEQVAERAGEPDAVLGECDIDIGHASVGEKSRLATLDEKIEIVVGDSQKAVRGGGDLGLTQCLDAERRLDTAPALFAELHQMRGARLEFVGNGGAQDAVGGKRVS